MVEEEKNGEILETEKVSAVHVALMRHGQDGPDIFLCRRVGGRFHAQWGVLGGKVDEGESSEEAAVREVMEEAGVELARGDLQPFGKTSSVESQKDGQIEYEFDVFIVFDDNLSPVNTSPDEHSEMRWVPLKAFDESGEREPQKSSVNKGTLKSHNYSLTPSTLKIVKQLVERERANASQQPKVVYSRPERKTG